jgi:hypothetical protein
MHNLNHKNTLSIKAASKTVLLTGDELSSFIEEHQGIFNISAFWPVVANKFRHIPNPTFQTIIR